MQSFIFSSVETSYSLDPFAVSFWTIDVRKKVLLLKDSRIVAFGMNTRKTTVWSHDTLRPNKNDAAVYKVSSLYPRTREHVSKRINLTRLSYTCIWSTHENRSSYSDVAHVYSQKQIRSAFPFFGRSLGRLLVDDAF